MKNQFNIEVKCFLTDNGTEYVNNELKSYFQSKGIIHLTTPPYAHESNGVVERFNRTICTIVRTMLADTRRSMTVTTESELDIEKLWGEATATATYIKNRLPHAALHDKYTPYEALLNHKPSISQLQPFGKMYYTHVPVERRPAGSKHAPRAERSMFVGYNEFSQSIYRVLRLKTLHVCEIQAAECQFVDNA